MGLGYYQGDYLGGADVNTSIAGARSLYNGNISTWSTSTQTGAHNLPYEEQLTGQRFTYDRLNRLKSSAFSSFAGGSWSEKAGEYATTYSYDPNGNILSLTRNAYAHNGQAVEMDQLTYSYPSQDNNLLDHVDDAATHELNGKLGDITDQQVSNYQYDGTGNMTRDEAEKLTIHWNVYGKISQVVPDQDKTSPRHISFSYDATGNRVKKQVNSAPAFDAQGKLVEQVSDPTKVVTTYYVRDGSGNVMAIYERTNEPAGTTPCDNPALCGEDLYSAVFRQVEVPLYGSDRVGQWSGGVEVARELFRKADFSNVSFTVDPLLRKSDLNNPLAASQNETVFGQDQEQVVAQESQLSVVDAQQGTLSPLVSFAGKLDHNVTVAEDSKGQVKFFAATASYWGTDNVQLLYDKQGKLLKDSRSTTTAVPSDEKARSVAAVDMQNPSSYYLFSRGTDGKVYYQQVNTSAVGFGSQQEPMGEITAGGELSGSGYGRNMAVVEDKLHGRSLLYLTGYDQTTGENKLLRVTLQGGTLSEPVELTRYTSNDTEGQGQLQLSHQGKELVVYNHLSRLGWYDHKEAELVRFSLDEDYKPLTGVTAKTTLLPAGNLAKGSVQYARDGKFLYYAQEALVLLEGTTSNKAVVKQGLAGELASASQAIAQDSKGDISISEGTFFSFGENAPAGKLWQEHNLVSKLLADLSAPAGSVFSGALSYAPHRVEEYNQLDGVLARQVGQKDYELKDHLGNVRVLVSDRKEWQNGILSAAVRGYYHYYPFGMQMPQLFFPGNTADNGGYRYGYNGKEKDDEFKGGGNSYDFDGRMLDTRLGRWLAVDPQAHRFPYASPYNYALNNPIILVDPNGESPKPSEYLQKELGVKLEPMAAGLIDGIIEGFAVTAMISFAADLADPQFREQFMATLQTIAADPVAFAKTVIAAEVEKVKNIVEFNEQGQYDLGAMIGEKAGAALSGGGAVLLIKYAKNFKATAKITRKFDCACFLAGTPVLTEQGHKPIEQIREGDSVWAYNEQQDTLELKRVTSTFIIAEPKQIYHLYIGGEVIKATGNHPFFLKGEWIEVQYLRAGDKVTLYSGEQLPIDSITVTPGQYTVYNFSVEDAHNYYVSSVGVLVHNCPDFGEYHQGSKHRKVSEGGPLPENVRPGQKAPAPEDGKNALDNSILVKEKSNGEQRISVEGKYFVVLDREGIKGSGSDKFHGHLRTWEQLSKDQRDILINNGVTNQKGKIIKK